MCFIFAILETRFVVNYQVAYMLQFKVWGIELLHPPKGMIGFQACVSWVQDPTQTCVQPSCTAQITRQQERVSK